MAIALLTEIELDPWNGDWRTCMVRSPVADVAARELADRLEVVPLPVEGRHVRITGDLGKLLAKKVQ